MIRDRIVVGIREDSIRHKLLQVRDLTLMKAIDICKASKTASEQPEAMSGADQVQSLHLSNRGFTRSKPRAREAHDDSSNRHERTMLRTVRATMVIVNTSLEQKHVLHTGSSVVAAERKIISSLSASRWWQKSVRKTHVTMSMR